MFKSHQLYSSAANITRKFLSNNNRTTDEKSVTGGTITQYTSPGPGISYKVHTFYSSGTFSLVGFSTFSADLLLVGGGASGSGGGGGGVVYHPNIPITNGSYVVTVGAGGELVYCNNGSCAPSPTPSGQGGPSSFGPYTIPGGSINPGANSAIPLGNQGPGGGSGGANHDAQPRNAGNGTPNAILGVDYYWGGGGGGGGNNNPGGTGGLGGGGGGGSNNGSGGSGGGSALNSGTPGGRTGPTTPTSPGGDGGTNTGGGGGAGLGGARGGSGIVIIRYQI